MLSFFDEMDRCADRLRANNPDFRDTLRNELQMEFRQRCKARHPELGTDEGLTLFDEWCERYASRLEAEPNAAITRLTDLGERCARANPAKPFVCACGAETRDPLDPAWMALHQAARHRRVARTPRALEMTND